MDGLDGQFEQLRKYFSKLDASQKKKFIGNLRSKVEKLENSKNSNEYEKFLNECINECIIAYNLELGQIYSENEDWDCAIECWVKAAEMGCQYSMKDLVFVYADSELGRSDSAKFFKWLDRLAKCEDAWAMVILGTILCGNTHIIWKHTFDENVFSEYVNLQKGIHLIEKGMNFDEGKNLNLYDYDAIADVYDAIYRQDNHRDLKKFKTMLMYRRKVLELAYEENNEEYIEIYEEWIKALEDEEKDIEGNF